MRYLRGNSLTVLDLFKDLVFRHFRATLEFEEDEDDVCGGWVQDRVTSQRMKKSACGGRPHDMLYTRQRHALTEDKEEMWWMAQRYSRQTHSQRTKKNVCGGWVNWVIIPLNWCILCCSRVASSSL